MQPGVELVGDSPASEPPRAWCLAFVVRPRPSEGDGYMLV
jgi:hypothetical protein